MRALRLSLLALALAGCTSFSDGGRYACDPGVPDPRDCAASTGSDGGATPGCNAQGWCEELALDAGGLAALSGNAGSVVVVGSAGLVAERSADGSWTTSHQGSADLSPAWVSPAGDIYAGGGTTLGGVRATRRGGLWSVESGFGAAFISAAGAGGEVVLLDRDGHALRLFGDGGSDTASSGLGGAGVTVSFISDGLGFFETLADVYGDGGYAHSPYSLPDGGVDSNCLGSRIVQVGGGEQGEFCGTTLTGIAAYEDPAASYAGGWVVGTGGFVGDLDDFISNSPVAADVGTTADLLAIWGDRSDDVWIGGTAGTLIRRTSSGGWAAQATDIGDDLIGLWGRPADGGTELFALTRSGVWHHAP